MAIGDDDVFENNRAWHLRNFRFSMHSKQKLPYYTFCKILASYFKNMCVNRGSKDKFTLQQRIIVGEMKYVRTIIPGITGVEKNRKPGPGIIPNREMT
jgi:hypothetical protein